MVEWLYLCIFLVYQHIMVVLGRNKTNNRTPVEHSDEGMIIAEYCMAFSSRMLTHYVVAKSAWDVYYFKLSYSVLVSYTYCI